MFRARANDEICSTSVNDGFVMRKRTRSQTLENVKVIPDGATAFSRTIGMLAAKGTLGFDARSWRSVAVEKAGVIEARVEGPGRSDNHGEDPYGDNAGETVLAWLRAPKAVAAG